MCKIKINRIMETTYEDGTSWVEYIVDGQYGYEITEEYEEGEEKKLLEDILNCEEGTLEGMINKPSVNVCSDYLSKLIKNTRSSDNEMWFVEFDDEEYTDEIIDALYNEVVKLKIDEYITFGEDDAKITVYGGVITRFLF